MDIGGIVYDKILSREMVIIGKTNQYYLIHHLIRIKNVRFSEKDIRRRLEKDLMSLKEAEKLGITTYTKEYINEIAEKFALYKT
ncbi:MAG TPA: hypothetical protein PKD00_00740 [Burkholderiales bacterium]|nr:hypothetical protein [Burkholderiales bacterium]